MSALFTMAGLTIREALRRRIYVGAFCIALLFLGLLFLPGLARHHRNGIELDPPLQAALITVFGLGMIKFFSAVLGITLASGAIATELERGTLYVILSKPLTRAHILLGKWLGLIALTALNGVVWIGLLWWAAYRRDPGPHWPLLKAAGLALLYPVMFVTLTLCLSTFTSNVLTIALVVIALGIGWQEGFMTELGRVFDIAVLRRFGVFAGYLVPIGRLHRAMIGVADLPELARMVMHGPGFREIPPAPSDLPYVGAYILSTLLLALLIFQRRDV
jgi:Cu-processing system permease protein